MDRASTSNIFIFTKPGTEAGESLGDIVSRKESERSAGNGIFWWGVGSSLGDDLYKAAQQSRGNLEVLFISHDRPSPPKSENAHPERVVRWTKWIDSSGIHRDVPSFARVTSRLDDRKRLHYALVCFSEAPIIRHPSGRRFNPLICRTFGKGLAPGSSQVTALVRADLNSPEHQKGHYQILFQAKLIAPWQPRLVQYQ